MKYEQAKAAAYTTIRVHDGYNGKTSEVGVTFDPESGKTFFVADCGYYPSPLPLAVDKAESEWLLNNHPIMRRVLA